MLPGFFTFSRWLYLLAEKYLYIVYIYIYSFLIFIFVYLCSRAQTNSILLQYRVVIFNFPIRRCFRDVLLTAGVPTTAIDLRVMHRELGGLTQKTFVCLHIPPKPYIFTCI